MSTLIDLIRWEARRLRRSAAVWISLGLLALAGFVSLGNGTAEIARQQNEIAALPAIYQQQLERLADRFPQGEHAGYLAYYLTYPTYQAPSGLGAFALGLRDVVPVAVWVRLLGLEAQLYEAGLGNPGLQSVGTFDLAFVICALAPLVLLILIHDTAARDRESGTFTLVTTQARRPQIVFAVRVGLRAAAVAAVCGLVLITGVIGGGVPLDARLAGWVMDAGLYLGLWTAVAAAVAATFKTTTACLTAGVATWIGTVVLIPSFLNLAVTTAFPVTDGLELTVRQRQEVHSGWDRPKEAVLDPFVAKRPEWAGTPPVTGRFAWKWYYAMHEMGDDSVARESAAFNDNLLARQAMLERFAWLSPSAYAQALLSRRAGTDLDAYLHHLQRVRAFHESIKDFFYPPVFAEQNLSAADFPRLPVFTPEPPPFRPPAAGRWPLVLITAAFLAATLLALRRHHRLS